MLTQEPFSASIQPKFFSEDTIEVARGLLGKYLVRRKDGKTYGGRIVETEAYLGLQDPACHSFHGKKTERTQTFYTAAGTIYVYLIYGMYFCLNFITGDPNTPEAVLIRALEPMWGIEDMKKNRGVTSNISLCNGPGKLCQAMSIDFAQNRTLLSDSLNLYDAPPVPEEDIVVSERIGLKPHLDSSYWPLRYYLKNNPYVSRP
jgi:DNA-3-methyladenine glycosylase